MRLELRRSSVPSPGARDARRSWSQRETLLVTLSDSAGQLGQGEASPLPGYSPDTLLDAENALRALDPHALSRSLQLATQTNVAEALADAASLVPAEVPSARMALETALLDLLGHRARTPAPRLLGATAEATRELAQLVGPASSDALLETASLALQAGFRHLKLKLGGAGQLEPELAGAARLREACGADVSLRVDANGALDADALLRAWQVLAALNLELFEEPGVVPQQLRGVLPLALDESLQGRSPAEVRRLIDERQARFLVLKPMALGGLTHCRRLIEVARELEVVPVLSHCFDGPWAFRATAALALALDTPTAHGLAPHAGLTSWSGAAPPVHAGQLVSWTEPGLGLGAEPGS